jgi:hypothetical protein
VSDGAVVACSIRDVGLSPIIRLINSDFFALAYESKIVVNVELIPRGEFP